MMIAFDATASITSDSVIDPEPVWMIFTFTCSFDSRSSDVRIGSIDPCTSVLRMMFSSFSLPALISPYSVSSVTCACWFIAAASRSRMRASTVARPVFSSETTCSSSPAFGTDCSPRISAGAEGPADLMRLPCSLSIAFTRPIVSPTTT